MTTSEIDKLEAGVELDRMVAEAIGATIWDDNWGDAGFLMELWPEEPRVFKPSTDWNDAMMALDRVVGTNDSKFPADKVYLEADENGWVVDLHKITDWREGDETNGWIDTPITSRGVAYAKASTGPVAICRAILKAKADGA